MNTILLTHTVTLESLSCGSCGVIFAIPVDMHRKVQGDSSKFYCPSGCHISYHKCENTKLKEELEQQKRSLEAARLSRDNALLEAEHFRKSRDGMKGALRKVSVRVKNGVCPCCKRTFSCLANHMKSKHPGFACEKVDAP